MAPFWVGRDNTRRSEVATKSQKEKACRGAFVYSHIQRKGTKPSSSSLCTNTIRHKAQKASLISSFVYCTAVRQSLKKEAKSVSEH